MSPRPSVPAPVYPIADVGALGGAEAAAGAVARLAGAGARWIQVRAKELADDELYRLVESACRAVEGTEARLWLDDRADVAALFPVAGLHLGQSDLPTAAARRLVGADLWLGLSTHDAGQTAAAAAAPEVDVVAIGPVYETSSKERPGPAVGLAGVRSARRLTDKPLVAIGGIDERRLPAVLEAGADAVAVLGAVCGAADPAAAYSRLAAVAASAGAS